MGWLLPEFSTGLRYSRVSLEVFLTNRPGNGSFFPFSIDMVNGIPPKMLSFVIYVVVDIGVLDSDKHVNILSQTLVIPRLVHLFQELVGNSAIRDPRSVPLVCS